MIEKIKKLPDHVFGVKVKDEVTEVDLKEVLLPGLAHLAETYGEIHYLLVLETNVKNFTAGASIQDMLAGIKHFSRWKRMAIVTDQKSVRTFTDLVSTVLPGKAKGFSSSQLLDAIKWVSGTKGLHTNKKPYKTLAISILGLIVGSYVLKKITKSK